jgi:aminoglycoside phosphotransferase (APT) family kinase protein
VHDWSAEEHVDEERAAQLIRAQLAPLPERSVELLSEGWDYAVHRVDERWVFRFPRREMVVQGTRRELACLPQLAVLLPVAVPAPVFVGAPGDGYPWPFYGSAFLPGRESTSADADAVARPLARALRALHSLELDCGLPPDPIGRVDMALRVPRARTHLDELGELTSTAQALLAEAETLPPASHIAVCHGDLHLRQLLVDGGVLSGIIDWVDICRSDPAVDLSIAWSLLPPAAREAFFDEYGAIDREREIRARVVAAYLSSILVQWARVEGVSTVLDEAAAGLRRAVAG